MNATFRYILLAFVSITLKLNAQEENSKIKQDSLAFELCQMYGFDQGIRDTSLNKYFSMTPEIDSINWERLILFIKKNGFPRKEILGGNFQHECVQNAAFAILLHNPHRIVENKDYFNFFMVEVNSGRMSKEYFSTILDKYYWAKGGRQEVLYGSGFGMPCIEIKEESNNARRGIGLAPLHDSLFRDCSKIRIK